MSNSADNFLSYCQTIAQEFESRVSRIKSFVSHALSTGTANETILREFLSSHVPKKFDVGEGFICNPFATNEVSKQCDVLVYNQDDFPLVYAVGSIKVVLPRAARMVVEIKTGFAQADIESGLSNIESAKQLNPYLTGVVVAYTSLALSTVMGHTENAASKISEEHLPTAILLLDKDLIIHRWHWLREKEHEENRNLPQGPFSIRRAKGSENGLALTFLLSLLFLATESELYESDVVNMLLDMFEKSTLKVTTDGTAELGEPLVS